VGVKHTKGTYHSGDMGQTVEDRKKRPVLIEPGLWVSGIDGVSEELMKELHIGYVVVSWEVQATPPFCSITTGLVTSIESKRCFLPFRRVF
jgi:hypothetical protein